MNRSSLPGIIDRPSPNHGERRGAGIADILLLHYTATKSAENAICWLCNPDAQASSHYVVDVDGTISRLVDEDLRAWHAGASYWKGDDDINSRSIGIEIQNEGTWGGSPEFPEAQMQAVETLCLDILTRHPIPAERVLGHSDVAPGRKIDPGERFDWARLADAGIGHLVEPAHAVTGDAFDLGDSGEEVRTFQALLSTYGYKIDATGLFDAQTKTVVSAFQLHFRQSVVDGVADATTRATLDRLLETIPAA